MRSACAGLGGSLSSVCGEESRAYCWAARPALTRTSTQTRGSDMPSPGEKSAKPEAARQQSRAAWNAVAPGWYAQREELWKASRPVSEWMVQRLDPQPGDKIGRASCRERV